MKFANNENNSNESLTSKVVRGGAWIYGRIFIISVVNLGVISVLARELSPKEFGIVALAKVVMNLLTVIGAGGVSQFVIFDNKEGREERVQAAFWMDLAFSSLSTLVGLLLIPFIAGFYSEPILASILAVILLRYPIDSLSKIPDALLKKRFDFKRLEIRDTFLAIFSSIISVSMALTGWGVWSLIIPGVIVSPLRAIIVFRMANWRLDFNFYFRFWPKIFNYSVYIIGSTLTTFTIKEGDTLLIGKLLGSGALGIYNLAWQTANFVINIVNGVVNKLALPALSSVSDNLKQMQFGLKRMMRVISIITFPLLIGLFVVADDFVLAVYGPKWGEVILPLRIMIIYAIRFSVGTPAGMVYKAIGRPDISFKLGLAIVPFYLIGIWVGSYYGIVGVAVGITFVRTVFGIIGFEIIARCLKMKFIEVLKPVFPAFQSSCWLGGLLFFAKSALNSIFTESYLFNLITLIILGGLIYLLLLRTLFNSLARDLVQISAPLLGSNNTIISKILKTNY